MVKENIDELLEEVKDKQRSKMLPNTEAERSVDMISHLTVFAVGVFLGVALICVVQGGNGKL